MAGSLLTRRARRAPASAARTPRLLLQWHVTERCNLRCRHCYQERHGGRELSNQEQLDVLDQLASLLARLRESAGARRVRTQVTLTGGEPFVHEGLTDLIDAIVRRGWRFAVLTNGALLDRERVRWLRRRKPRFVQVSVEGGQSTHDRIRGPGTYRRALRAVRLLVRASIPTLLAFTAHRGNASEFASVARAGCRLGVTRVWADRLIPCGAGTALHDDVLTTEETRTLFEDMARMRREAASDSSCRTEIAMHRALQFLVGGGPAYRCSAGRSLLTLMPDGDVLPCRRLPLRVGNVREEPLAAIYEGSGLLRRLRDPDRVADGCQGCAYALVCGGGLRCLAHATCGDPFRADPGCWRAHGSER